MADLGPPLEFLPKDLELQELQAYRYDYQAFRAGHPLGAHGEIEALLQRHGPKRQMAYSSEPEVGAQRKPEATPGTCCAIFFS